MGEIATMRAEEVTVEVQEEADALQIEMKALATQEQAAILAEGEEEGRARGIIRQRRRRSRRGSRTAGSGQPGRLPDACGRRERHRGAGHVN